MLEEFVDDCRGDSTKEKKGTQENHQSQGVKVWSGGQSDCPLSFAASQCAA